MCESASVLLKKRDVFVGEDSPFQKGENLVGMGKCGGKWRARSEMDHERERENG